MTLTNDATTLLVVVPAVDADVDRQREDSGAVKHNTSHTTPSVVLRKAQTPLFRGGVELLHNKLYNKPT